jgi:hypothetical protein
MNGMTIIGKVDNYLNSNWFYKRKEKFIDFVNDLVRMSKEQIF